MKEIHINKYISAGLPVQKKGKQRFQNKQEPVIITLDTSWNEKVQVHVEKESKKSD